MIPRRKKGVVRGIAALTALGVVALGGMVPAGAVTSAAVATSDDAPTDPLPTPEEGRYDITQAVQLRVDANGEPNANAVNFRWSITQVTIQGGDIPETVPVPEQGVGLRSLQTFDFISGDEETGTAEIPVEDFGTYGTARTVSLVPQDYELPVALEVEFTLDGEPILAEDLLGKDGVVTAQYTIKNLSGKTMDVPITAVGGEEEVVPVTADVPFVSEATALIPQRYTGLATGAGLGSGDGRGNTLVKWITLPFAPINPSEATFGWAANVTDAIIPSMIIQVLPIYIPEGHGGEEEEAEEESGSSGANVDPAVAEIKAGLTNVIAGLQGFANKEEGPDPLTVLERKINNLFRTIGANLTGIAQELSGLPELLRTAQTQIRELRVRLTTLENLLQRIDNALDPGTVDRIEDIANNWEEITQIVQRLDVLLPQLRDFLKDPNLPIDCSVPNPADTPAAGTVSVGEVNRRLIERAGGTYKGFADTRRDLPPDLPGRPNSDKDGYVYGNGSTAGAALWNDATGTWDDIQSLPTRPTQCRGAVFALNVALQSAFENSQEVQDLLDRVIEVNRRVQAIADRPALDPDNAAEIQEKLLFIANELPGIVTALRPLVAGVDGLLGRVSTTLGRLGLKVERLSNTLGAAGEATSGKSVALPTVDEVVEGIVSDVLATPNAVLVTTGLDQASAGVAVLKSEVSAYVSTLVAAAQEKGAAAVETINTLKAEVAGMKMAAHQSPLPYGGDPANVPPNTAISGAYEFRVDAADWEQPSTAERLLVGLAALLIAGFIGGRALRNRRAAPAGGPAPTPVSMSKTDLGGITGGGSA